MRKHFSLPKVFLFKKNVFYEERFFFNTCCNLKIHKTTRLNRCMSILIIIALSHKLSTVWPISWNTRTSLFIQFRYFFSKWDACLKSLQFVERLSANLILRCFQTKVVRSTGHFLRVYFFIFHFFCIFWHNSTLWVQKWSCAV